MTPHPLTGYPELLRWLDETFHQMDGPECAHLDVGGVAYAYVTFDAVADASFLANAALAPWEALAPGLVHVVRSHITPRSRAHKPLLVWRKRPYIETYEPEGVYRIRARFAVLP